MYPLAGDDRRLTYSNRALQIRVVLELADYCWLVIRPPAQPQTQIPKSNKYTKSSSNVGFGG